MKSSLLTGEKFSLRKLNFIQIEEQKRKCMLTEEGIKLWTETDSLLKPANLWKTSIDFKKNSELSCTNLQRDIAIPKESLERDKELVTPVQSAL